MSLMDGIEPFDKVLESIVKRHKKKTVKNEIDALRLELAKARDALHSCVSGTHMWVITPESAQHCKEWFEYIRTKASEALRSIEESGCLK